MINSLLKDSHITLSKRIPNSSYSERCTYQSSLKRTAPAHRMNNDNFNITVNKPAEISFSGLSYAHLANDAILKAVVKDARTFLNDSKPSHKTITKFVNDAVEMLQTSKNSANEKVTEFLSSNTHKENVFSMIKKTEDLIIKKNENAIERPLELKDFEELNKSVKKTINEAVEVFPTVENPKGIYTSKGFKKFFKMAENSQAVFSALFAAGLACILRPVAIMSLPGKKNKEDKKYASAHSIASGFIGYVVALIIGSPIAAGIGKIAKRPKFFLKEGVEYLADKDKPLSKIAGTDQFKIAKRYVNMLPEILLAIPKATITIALIPPILKYVFGLDKKHTNNNNNNKQSTVLQNYTDINFKSIAKPEKKVFQNFMGVLK